MPEEDCTNHNGLLFSLERTVGGAVHRMRQADLRHVPRRARRLPQLPARGEGRGRNRHASANPGAVPPRPAPASVRGTATVATPPDPVESRALVALGYPLWPLALISLLDRKQSRSLRRQALQALGFNLGFFGFWGAAVADRADSVPRLFRVGARAAARTALPRRQRLLRHQDLERRRRTHSGRHQLARRAASSGRDELAVAPQKSPRRDARGRRRAAGTHLRQRAPAQLRGGPRSRLPGLERNVLAARRSSAERSRPAGS